VEKYRAGMEDRKLECISVLPEVETADYDRFPVRCAPKGVFWWGKCGADVEEGNPKSGK